MASAFWSGVSRIRNAVGGLSKLRKISTTLVGPTYRAWLYLEFCNQWRLLPNNGAYLNGTELLRPMLLDHPDYFYFREALLAFLAEGDHAA